MRAIILAAGRGNRLGTLTNDKPKCLIEVNGRPLIEWQLSALRGAGIKDIAIVTGYMAEKIKYSNITYFKNDLWAKTNMVFSLLLARNWLENHVCIVSYSDIIYPSQTIEKIIKADGDLILPYNSAWLSLWEKRFSNPLEDAETFQINEKGILIEIGRRAKTITEIQGQYMGLFKSSPKGWEKIDRFLRENILDIDTIDMTSLLQNLIKKGVTIHTLPVNDNWFEIDNTTDIELCSSLLNLA